MEERPSYRLPRNVLPEHYALVLMPDLDHAAFDGEVIVDVRVVELANEVVLNAAELDIVDARLHPGRTRRRPGHGLLPGR